MIRISKNQILLGCAINAVIIGLVIYFLLPLIWYVLQFLVIALFLGALGYTVFTYWYKFFTKLKPVDPVISFVFQILGYYSTKCVNKNDSLNFKHLGDVAEGLNLSDHQFSTAVSYFNYGNNLTESLVKQLIRDNKKLYSNPFDRRKLFDWVVQLFFSDSVVGQQQIDAFNQIGALLGYSEEKIQYKFKVYLKKFRYFYDSNSGCYRNGFNFNEFFSRFYEQMRQGQSGGTYGGSDSSGYSGYDYTANKQADLATAYRILGIDENTSDSDAKKAYLRLMNRYHPDKAAARGLSEEDIEKYKDMTQKIQAAWQVVKQHRNL
ncbi:MAG: DnaJ domain-containing protein [Succinivibrionaceae bacterium]|jgi:DnaJ-domain-containing protein 1|nr:DnaJ domain-containing protein [Succinivibrionaceae bacterium]